MSMCFLLHLKMSKASGYSFPIADKTLSREVKWQNQSVYLYCSPFHSSMPFEHLGQSSLCINQVIFLFYFRTETVSQESGFLKIYSAFVFR